MSVQSQTRPRPFEWAHRVLTVVENLAAGVPLVAAVGVALAAILLREVFGVFLFWSEEAIIYLVITSTFFGSVLTMRSKEHVNVDIIGVFLRRRGKRSMAILAAVITTLYMSAIGALAWALIFEPFSSSTVTPALKLPLWVVELPIALAMTLMFFHGIEEIAYAWRHGADEVSATDAALAEAEAAGIGSEELQASREAEASARRRRAPDHVPGDPLHYLPPGAGRTGGRRPDDIRPSRTEAGRRGDEPDETGEDGDRP